MSRIKTISLSGVTADDNGIVVSVTPAAGGEQALTIAGQPPQPIILDVTWAGADTGRTITFVGTDRGDNVITEVVTGTGIGTDQTTKQFKTVTSATVDDDTAGAIIIGWAAVVYGPWYPVNALYCDTPEYDINVVVTGTVSFDLEYTYDDLYQGSRSGLVQGDIEPLLGVVVDADIDADTASIRKTLTLRAQAIRLKLNSGTGSLAGHITQAGNR